MKHVFKLLCLLAALIVAQQGAVVHELSHVFHAQAAASASDVSATADSACALCPAFAHVVTPAFSHSLHIPLAVLVAAQRISELRIVAIDASVPHPRSRGPPSSS